MCPKCHNQVFLHHVRSEKRVSLNFVPLVPPGSEGFARLHADGILTDAELALAKRRILAI